MRTSLRMDCDAVIYRAMLAPLCESGCAVKPHDGDIAEAELREALMQPDPLWDELFPAEQARIVQLQVERVDIGLGGLDVRLRVDGISGLVREMASDVGQAV